MNPLRYILTILSLLCVWPAYSVGPAIIPLPRSMKCSEGSYLLNRNISIAADNLSEGMEKEISKFMVFLSQNASISTKKAKGNGDITVSKDSSLPQEGYRLAVTPDKIKIEASTSTGLFYAFQTLKKMLPVQISAGKMPKSDISFPISLPSVEIEDEPRFSYRGFMLDVSRHFFDASQIKKMLDLMAVYKLNRFHWHLTDDQGWRLPVDKYPELTEKGAVNRNILLSDFETQKQTRAGENTSYGPFAYTKEEIRDIVDYARERHIEIIPEVDMPGHMVAAIHTYPQFSTDPESRRAIAAGIALHATPDPDNVESHFTYNIWNTGGISSDVLDISKPEVITFAKDVIDALADLFPFQYIHIGGDECPVDAWKKSEACQQLKKNLGLRSDEALQTWFMNEIAAYAKEKHGRKIMGWNEIITAEGADRTLIKKIDPVIFCWYPAEQGVEICEKEGIPYIYTPFNGGYYINRSYKGIDKIGAGRDGSLFKSYNINPPGGSHCLGVQGTFWTEQVDRPRDLEYLALPRLIAIAEQGWTPVARKDYRDFLRRLESDLPYLDAAGYNYGRHQLSDRPE